MEQENFIQEVGWQKFKADDYSYEKVRAFVENSLEDLEISPKIQLKVMLGFEETMENIINYAYSDPEVFCPVWLKLTKTNEKLSLDMVDYGVPFDPLAQEDARPKEKNLQDRRLGGYGIHLLKATFSEVGYVYENFKGQMANHLTLTINL